MFLSCIVSNIYLLSNLRTRYSIKHVSVYMCIVYVCMYMGSYIFIRVFVCIHVLEPLTSRFVCWVTYKPVGPGAYHLLFCYMCVYLKIVNTQVTILKKNLLIFLILTDSRTCFNFNFVHIWSVNEYSQTYSFISVTLLLWISML